MVDESRLQKRVAKNLLAKVKVNESEFFGYVFDVSKKGMGLRCNREINVGDSVSMALNVPKYKTMHLNGKIAWKNDLPTISKQRYQYGVVLDAITEPYEDYVESLLKNVYEHRKDPRFKNIVEIKSDEVLDLLDAAIEDISARGLYVRTSRPLPVGSQYEIALKADIFENPLYCLGEVVASFECDDDVLDHPYGAGIKIVSFIGEDGTRFSEYIRHLEKLYRFHWPEQAEVE